MKKILLVIALLFFYANAEAQKYTFKIEGYIGQGKSTCGTNKNGLKRITVYFNNGTSESFIYYPSQFINDSYSKTKEYNVSKRVTRVEFHTITRKRKKISGCKSSKEAWKTVHVSSPCFSRYYTKEEVYKNGINKGWARITITPNVNISFTDGSSIGKVKTTCSDSFAEIKAKTGFESWGHNIYKWEFLDPINTETQNTPAYRILLNALEKAKQRLEDCIRDGGGSPMPGPDYLDKKNTTLRGPGRGDCERQMSEVKRLEREVENHTPKTEQVPVWRPINSKNGRQNIKVYLSNLYSSPSDREKALNNKVFTIRLNPNCNGKKDKSNEVRIQFLPKPPEKDKDPEFNKPSCNDGEIGNFKFFFKRQLYPNEKIEISLERQFKDGTYTPIFQNVSIKKLVKEGTNLYSYKWIKDNGKNIIGGNYRVKISGFDEKNTSPLCLRYIYDFTINVPPPVTFTATLIQQKESCFNAKDGKIKITASGGHEFVFSGGKATSTRNSYQYSLNNGATWSSSRFENAITVTGLAPKVYNIKVRDRNGCKTTPVYIKKTILAASKITHTATVNKHPSASGQSDGQIKINNLKGGVPIGTHYNYKILKNGSPSNIIKTGKAYVNNTFTGLPAGTHKIVYTDNNGCTQTYTLPTLTDPAPITFTLSSNPPDCNGGSNGNITITNIRGGYPTYKVVITKIGGGYSKTISNVAENQVINVNVTAGNYKVVATDARLIAVTQKSTTVNTRSKITITNVQVSPILCNGSKSTIKITATGGKTGSYQYAIYKSSGMVWQNSNKFLLPASPSIGYRFQVRDRVVTSCKSVRSTAKKITQPTPIEIVNSGTIVKHNDVFGESNGKITLQIDGGVPAYTVSWKKKEDSSFSKTGNPVSGLSAGFYTAKIVDKKGCSINSSEIEIEENPELITSLNITKEIKCNGQLGSLTAVTHGGHGSYTYQWFKEGTLISGETTNALNDVAYGNYSVKVYDDFTNTSAVKELKNVLKVELSVTKTNITCFGKDDGSIKIIASGGSGGYLYSIDNKTSYHPVSTLPSNTITGLVKGSYDVWLKDKKDCEISTPINVIIDEPIEIKIDSSAIVNCDIAGDNKGEITIETSGGHGALTYTWSKTGTPSFIETTKNITGLYAGIYNVSIKDDSNCEVIRSFEVKEPLPIQVTIQETNSISCFSGDNGSLLAVVSGGYPIISTPADFEYRWYIVEGATETPLNTDFTLNSLSGLVTGKYKVVANDSRGATTSTEIILDQPTKIEINLEGKQDVSCFEGSDGKIDIAVIGGVSGYTYLWTKESDVSFSRTTKNIENITLGKYKVEVQDTNSCKMTSATFEIKQPAAALSIQSFDLENLTGFETANGSIAVTMTGGTPSYNYEWRVEGMPSIIGTNHKIENLPIGTYEVTIKDSKGCQVIETYALTQPELLEITSITQSTNILCFGDKGINLLSTVDGGVEPYTYSWTLKGNATELSNTSTLNNVGAGTYVLNVTDANAIIINKEYNLLEPSLLQSTLISTQNVSCHAGNNGSIEVEATGGTPPYVYNWSHGETGNLLTNLTSGDYTVTVRDKNLCETIRKVTISEPLTGLTLISEVKTDVTGNGLSNGSIQVEIAGGTAPYTYQWKNGSDTILGSTANSLLAIEAGNYTLVVTDSQMCELTRTYTIKEPLPLLVEIKETPVLCKGEKGVLTTTVTGGVEPYLYTWYNSIGTVIGTTPNLNYEAGTYKLKVVDAKSNTVIKNNIKITEPPLLEITSVNIKNVECYDGTDGSIKINVTGGVKPYNYKWNHSTIDANEVTVLTAGRYSVVVTDKNGCTITKENIDVTEPDVYDIIETKLIRPSNSTVNNGSIHVKIVGGVEPYNYVWKDKDDLEIANRTNNNKFDKIENLEEGVYKIIITDAKGCITEDTYNLADPGELLVSVIQTKEISCFGGSDGILDVVPVGGVGGNNYTWYNATTATVIGMNRLLENIPAGQYYVVVNNAEGVEEQSAVFTVNEPTKVMITGSVTNLACFESNDGEIKLNITGGSGIYQYRYRIQGNSFSSWIPIASNFVDITNLQAANYGVQLRDSNNCYAINTLGSDEYLYTIDQPNFFNILTEVVVEPTGYGLSNGSINISVESGIAPYTYQWKKEGVVIANETSNLATNTIDTLSAGTYTIKVTNSNGCTTEKIYTLEQPLKLETTINLISVISCKGDTNGALKAQVTGGVLNYTYKWFKEGEPTVIGTEKNLYNLGEGKYYVEITDAKGNTTQSASYELIEPEILILTLSADYVSCGTAENWTVTPTVLGGTAPYSYLWDTGSNNANLENVTTGTYELTVVDANGCRTNATTTFSTPEPIELNKVEIINPTCYEGNDGKIILNIKGGAAPYKVDWNNKLTGSTIENLTAGTYEAIITDVKGCTFTSSFEVINPPKIEFDLGETITLCKDQTYILDAFIENGVAYTWTSNNGFSSNDAQIEVATAGIYDVVIKTKLGCIVSDTIEIKQSEAEINSEFTMSSQVYTNESFVIVNFSDPKPDEVEWIFPENATVIEKNENYAEILIEEEGEYEITVIAKIGNCEEFITKKVLVLEKEVGHNIATTNETSNKSILNGALLYPNSSSGKFNLDIELNEESTVNLKFYRLNSTIIKQEEYNGKNIYNLDYDFNLTPGIYFVLIETKNERIIKKIIIN